MFLDHLKNNQRDVLNYTLKAYHLKGRLLKKFSKNITIITYKSEALVKPFNGIIVQNKVDKQNILEAAAQILNEEIRQIKRTKLPEQINTKNLIEGECEVPETLLNFYRKIVAGENYRGRQNKKTTRLAQSFSEDLIYGVHNGRMKLSKHICLGMPLKSLTNRQKIVDIVHRYGHCCSYSALEGLETTFTSCEVSYKHLTCVLKSHSTTMIAL